MIELAKTYDPQATEARWQQAWEESGAFHPDPEAPGEPFSLVTPPPNVTGSLHMGHAFNTALIDTIVRFQRMQGKNVLCLPGTDHASIAVQTILEKQLKAEGSSKEELGREGFLGALLGLEGRKRRAHRQPAAPPWFLGGLAAGALHPRCRLQRGGDRSLRQPA